MSFTPSLILIYKFSISGMQKQETNNLRKE